MWALLTLIVISCIELGIALAKHGQPKEGKYSFWVYLFSCAVQYWLLYEAGLFDKYIDK